MTERKTPNNNDEHVTLYDLGDAIRNFEMEIARPVVPVVDAINRWLLWLLEKLR